MNNIDQIIRDRLYNHPNEWQWEGNRFLKGNGITLVLSANDERWTFVVGNQIGYIKLSYLTHCCIEMARKLKHIESK